MAYLYSLPCISASSSLTSQLGSSEDEFFQGAHVKQRLLHSRLHACTDLYHSQNHQPLKSLPSWLTRTVPCALRLMCTVLNSSLHISFSYCLIYPQLNIFHQTPIAAAGCSSSVFLHRPEEPSPVLGVQFC